jgi:hypothetical protein
MDPKAKPNAHRLPAYLDVCAAKTENDLLIFSLIVAGAAIEMFSDDPLSSFAPAPSFAQEWDVRVFLRREDMMRILRFYKFSFTEQTHHSGRVKFSFKAMAAADLQLAAHKAQLWLRK